MVHSIVASDDREIPRQARLRDSADTRQPQSGLRVRVVYEQPSTGLLERHQTSSFHRLDAHKGSLSHSEAAVEFQATRTVHLYDKSGLLGAEIGDTSPTFDTDLMYQLCCGICCLKLTHQSSGVARNL